MVQHRLALRGASLALSLLLVAAPALGAAGAESDRLDRAKDLIGDEQWLPAIQELQAAAADLKEPNKDEALFWLAHCESQARDTAAAVDTIQRLEREYPRSAWVKPARSLRIEIAQRLRRSDVLWYTAAPPSPPAAPSPPVPAAAFPAPAPPPPPFPPPPPAWLAEGDAPDTDLRIQALGSLMRTDASRVIPMLKDIALRGSDPGESRRAIFLLAQSSRADARATVVEMARTGPEPVRLEAVRELGRLGGPAAPNELLQVYATGSERIKYQVVASLGQRDAAAALMQIAQSEANRSVREAAITTLGEAGGRAQLSALYTRLQAASADMKRPIVLGLFNAQADDELIRIAERERDPRAREEVLSKLRLLGTAKATAYLDSVHR
jgi:HEAT repeat protein